MEEKGDQRHSSTQEIHTYTEHNLYLCLRVCVRVNVRGRRDAHTWLRTGPLTCLQN